MSEQRDDAVTDDGTTRPVPEAPGTEQPATPEAEPAAAGDSAAATRLRLRRAPRYRRFGLTGTLIGVVAGVALALSFTAASNYSMQTIAGYFAAIFGLTGTVVGLGLAVLIERRAARRR